MECYKAGVIVAAEKIIRQWRCVGRIRFVVLIPEGHGALAFRYADQAIIAARLAVDVVALGPRDRRPRHGAVVADNPVGGVLAGSCRAGGALQADLSFAVLCTHHVPERVVGCPAGVVEGHGDTSYLTD